MPRSSDVLIHLIRDVTVVNFNQAIILDATEILEMGEQLYDLVDSQARKKIILDFSKVKSLSSSALGVLLTLRKKADEIKGQVVICGLRDELKRVFKISGLHKLFTFCADEEEALAKFGVTTAG